MKTHQIPWALGIQTCTMLSPGPLFRLALERRLEVVSHKRLFLCFVLCLLPVTSIFVCFSFLFLKQNPV